MLALMRPMIDRNCFKSWALGLTAFSLGLALPACQPQQELAQAAATPPVGHYEGSISAGGQPELRAALDIRHPSPGHYEAEFTVPTAGALSFVADTIFFSNNQLRLTRPARPGQVLTLTLDGDFWRGSLALDSTKIPVLLVKRGAPTPSAYRVEEVPQAAGSAWLFAPADTSTPGAALALLPDAETAPTAALWADALAREGLIVLLLPAADSATAPAEAPRLQTALRLLHSTAGADTANIGAWAAGLRAGALAQLLAGAGGPRVAFVIAQNAEVDPAARTAFQALQKRKLPILGLYGGAGGLQRAAGLRNALGRRGSNMVRTYRTTGADLLVPAGLSPRFGPGLPADVVEWLQGK
ncbi:hypothetical protein [Hymenobacter terricola]|uniref:hypothetical protein n=1 Tax=Hymenobacter terricola TaxID=2819236 RepID=UPI001B30EEC9|nr:hypothetical protein [Hymenobacter terricola]